jgi:hypothetical protein
MVIVLFLAFRAKKLLNLRIFPDPLTNKQWEKSVIDLGLEILCISQVREPCTTLCIGHIVRSNVILIHSCRTWFIKKTWCEIEFGGFIITELLQHYMNICNALIKGDLYFIHYKCL